MFSAYHDAHCFNKIDSLHVIEGIQNGELVRVAKNLVTPELALVDELVAPHKVEGIVELVEGADRLVHCMQKGRFVSHT